MPRKARIDVPGALQHIIVRGIARRKIFDDNADRDFFADRIGVVLANTRTRCFACALIPNHFHLLLKTGDTPIATVMKRLLTGYAMHRDKRWVGPVYFTNIYGNDHEMWNDIGPIMALYGQ